MIDLTGQIGLVPHPKSFVEWAIQVVTRSPVHHAILGISPTQCISDEPHGPIIRDIADFPDAYWSYFDHTPEQSAEIVAWGHAHVKTKYGYFADAALFLWLVLGIHTPGWLARYLNNGTHFECAQFCDAAYQAAGIHLFNDGRLPSAVYPGSFVPIFRANGWM